MLRWLFGVVILALAAAGATYCAAGRGAPPAITISQPDRFVGQTGTVDVTVSAPSGRFASLTIALEQNGRTVPLFSLAGSQSATLTQVDRDHMHVSRPLGKESVPELQEGDGDDRRLRYPAVVPAACAYSRARRQRISRSDSSLRASRSSRASTT